MRKIFISYRRNEAEYAAGALFRELCGRFGEDQVFRDKEAIGGGESWKKKVLAEIDHRSALLVFIGRDWAATLDAEGKRRIDNPEDPLRLELLDGFKDGAAVIPILLENAQMPCAADLPQELRDLAELNALRLRDSDWHYDLDNLFRTLEKTGFQPIAAAQPAHKERVAAAQVQAPVPQPPTPSRGAPIKLILSYLLIGLLFLGFFSSSDVETHLGFTLFGVGSVVLAIFAYRDYQHGRSTVAWPAISAIVLAIMFSLVHVAVAGMAQTQAAINGAMSDFNNGYDAPSVPTNNEPLNISGRWFDNTNGVYSDFYQQGNQVTTVCVVNGYRWDGVGQLIGNNLMLNVGINGVTYATVNVVVGPDGRHMSGTMSNQAGTMPINYSQL